MKNRKRLYIFTSTLIIFLFVTGCRLTKPFSCIWQNPLNYAYDSLINIDSIRIVKIKTFTKYIDSFLENDGFQKFVVNSIAEGKITQEEVKTLVVGHSNKIDTTRSTKIGGFGKYTSENIKGDTVYKILYHDNINKNFYEIYYYKDNKLVYSKIDYQEDGIGETFYYREEFYQDNKLLLKHESTMPIDSVFKKRVTFNLMKKGKDYFEKFQVDKN